MSSLPLATQSAPNRNSGQPVSRPAAARTAANARYRRHRARADPGDPRAPEDHRRDPGDGDAQAIGEPPDREPEPQGDERGHADRAEPDRRGEQQLAHAAPEPSGVQHREADGGPTEEQRTREERRHASPLRNGARGRTSTRERRNRTTRRGRPVADPAGRFGRGDSEFAGFTQCDSTGGPARPARKGHSGRFRGGSAQPREEPNGDRRRARERRSHRFTRRKQNRTNGSWSSRSTEARRAWRSVFASRTAVSSASSWRERASCARRWAFRRRITSNRGPVGLNLLNEVYELPDGRESRRPLPGGSAQTHSTGADEAVGARVPVVPDQLLPAGRDQPVAQTFVGADPRHARAHRSRVGRVAGQHRGAAHLGQTRRVTARDRRSGGERLEQRHAETFEQGEEDQRLARANRTCRNSVRMNPRCRTGRSGNSRCNSSQPCGCPVRTNSAAPDAPRRNRAKASRTRRWFLCGQRFAG